MKIRMMVQAVVALVAGMVVAGGAQAQVCGDETLDSLSKLYPGKGYSPYAQRNFPSRVYWGETHLHTGLSLDAGVFGNTLRPADAYKLARGEQVTSSTGQPVKLGRPLDWLVVTDHTDLMGIAPDIQQGTLELRQLPRMRVAQSPAYAKAFVRLRLDDALKQH